MANSFVEFLYDGYLFCPMRTFGFDLSETQDVKVIVGFDKYENYCPEEGFLNIFLDFEEPNFLVFRDQNFRIDVTKKFDRKLTLCPYSAKFYNDKIGKKVVYDCFFPTNVNYIRNVIGDVDFDMKIYDTIYFGNRVSQLTEELKKRSISHHTPTYISKIDILYKSKIAICHNIVFFNNLDGGIHARVPHDPNGNQAWDDAWYKMIEMIPDFDIDNPDRLLPQLKSRIFEAGFSKCIPLVYYDKFEIVEKYFTPNEDFLYFRNLDELDSLISLILNDYSKYQYIAENIYKKCMENYTTEHFVKKYCLSSNI